MSGQEERWRKVRVGAAQEVLILALDKAVHVVTII